MMAGSMSITAVKFIFTRDGAEIAKKATFDAETPLTYASLCAKAVTATKVLDPSGITLQYPDPANDKIYNDVTDDDDLRDAKLDMEKHNKPLLFRVLFGPGATAFGATTSNITPAAKAPASAASPLRAVERPTAAPEPAVRGSTVGLPPAVVAPKVTFTPTPLGEIKVVTRSNMVPTASAAAAAPPSSAGTSAAATPYSSPSRQHADPSAGLNGLAAALQNPQFRRTFDDLRGKFPCVSEAVIFSTLQHVKGDGNIAFNHLTALAPFTSASTPAAPRTASLASTTAGVPTSVASGPRPVGGAFLGSGVTLTGLGVGPTGAGAVSAAPGRAAVSTGSNAYEDEQVRKLHDKFPRASESLIREVWQKSNGDRNTAFSELMKRKP